MKANRVDLGMCEKHYGRVRRNGHVNVLRKEFSVRSAGYIVRNGQPDHPLSNKNNSIYEHRYQAYAKYGGECQPCHWCGIDQKWSDCVIDHLDEDKANNTHENIVCSCNRCNRARGQMLSFFRSTKNKSVAIQAARLMVEQHGYSEIVDECKPCHDRKTARGE